MQNMLFCLFLCSFSFSFGQHKEEKIIWEEDRKLSWIDFQGKPDHKVPFHANTSSGILYSWSLRTSGDDQEFLYEVVTGFYPGSSWVKEGKESDHLLAHEQLHFDITELHARKLREALAKYKLGKNPKRELEALYNKINRDRGQMQKKFDAETRHSQNKEAQAKWQSFIRSALQQY